MPAAAAPPAAVTPAAPRGPQLKTRKPTGEVGYPLILLAGEEKAGKSLVPVVLSCSTRVGMMYWFDLGEGAADEYAALPGSEYLVIEHDGTYRDILEQLTAVWHEANRAAQAGEPPVVVVFDSASAEWTMLVNWTNDRARRSRGGQSKLEQDPDAEIDPTSNLWNDATKRHYRLMHLLMTFPGIAVLTARGKEVSQMKNGQPDPNAPKLLKPEGQKGLAYDVDAWIWMSRGDRHRTSELMGVRSLRVNEGDALPTTKVGKWDVLDLDAFIFDTLGAVGPKGAEALKTLRGDELEGVVDMVATCPTEGDLQAIWKRYEGALSTDQRELLSQHVKARLARLRSTAPDDQPPADTDGPDLGAHGPTSDAEKLRQAAADAARTANGSLAGGSPMGEAQS